jgi:hypothetical protein
MFLAMGQTLPLHHGIGPRVGRPVGYKTGQMVTNVRLRTSGVNYGLSKVSKHLVAAGPEAALPGPLRVYRRRAVTRHRVFF